MGLAGQTNNIYARVRAQAAAPRQARPNYACGARSGSPQLISSTILVRIVEVYLCPEKAGKLRIYIRIRRGAFI